MSGRSLLSLGIVVVTLGVTAVILLREGSEDGGGGSEPAADTSERRAANPEPERPEPEKQEPPQNPDDVKGSEERALNRPRNLRRALAVLERRRRAAKQGVFDSLRIAPGRIDTVVETLDRRNNLQVNTAFDISFETAHEFPNQPDYKRRGITAEVVDTQMPRRMLDAINRDRPGNAARDLDYFVVRRDIIDREVDWSVYLRSGARPRSYLLEGRTLRAIG